jgi:mRNA interferase YafQ
VSRGKCDVEHGNPQSPGGWLTLVLGSGIGTNKDERPLGEKHRDHKLPGEYEGARDCHIEPDWLLTYTKYGDARSDTLTLIRTGSRSELL